MKIVIQCNAILCTFSTTKCYAYVYECFYLARIFIVNENIYESIEKKKQHNVWF